MASTNERNHQALMALVETLKVDGFLVPRCFRLRTMPYVPDGSREYDARLFLPLGVIVIVVCVDEEIQVEITPPEKVAFLLADESKSKLGNLSVDDDFTFMKVTLELSSTVIITRSLYPSDSCLVKRDGDESRLDVYLRGETRLPRLKLLLERLCCGLLDSLAATELAPS